MQNPVHSLLVQPDIAFGHLTDAGHQSLGRNGAVNNAVSAAAEEFQHLILAGAGGEHNEIGMGSATQQLADGFGGLSRQRGFKQNHIGAELGDGGNGLAVAFRLANHADIIFQGENLAQADPENGLAVGHDQAGKGLTVSTLRVLATALKLNRAAGHNAYCFLEAVTRSKPYSSITTPTQKL